MSEYYISPNTASTGFAMCGLAMCGIYGIYNDVPEGVSPGDDDFPSESLPLIIELNGRTIYPLKGTLSWDESLGTGESLCSCSYVATSEGRPQPYMRIRIGIGSINMLLWSGYILSFSETRFGGLGLTAELEYTIKATNLSHYFVRRLMSYATVGKYSGTILKEIITKFLGYRHQESFMWIPHLKVGKLHAGIYYNIFQATEESISTVIQKLIQEGELSLVVSPDGYVSAKAIGSETAPFHLTHEENNFSDVEISEEGGQLVTRLFLDTSTYVQHSVFACSQKSDYANTADYLLSPGQTTFYVDTPIGYIRSINVTFRKHAEEAEEGEEQSEDELYSYTWIDPIAPSVRNGMSTNAGGAQCNFGQQFSRIADEQWKHKWYVGLPVLVHVNALLNWELRDTESGKSFYLANNNYAELDDNLFPFDWTISYDSNAVSFNTHGQAFGGKPKQVQIDAITITYYEAKPITRVYNHTTQQTTIQTFDSTDNGIIEHRLSYPELTEKTQHDQVAKAFFDYRGRPQLTCSYTTYLDGINIFTQSLRPGMQQALQLYGRNTVLLIHNISYSIQQGMIPELRAEVTLATQQRDLANLITRMIRGKH